MDSNRHHPLSHLRGRVVAALFLWGSGLTATFVGAEGIPMGNWVFRPSVEVLWQDEDNLFLTSEDPIPATSYALRPNLDWALPFRESQFRLRYSPQLRRFVDRTEEMQGLDDKYISHFVDVDLDLKFSNQLSVKFHDEYTVDTFETARFDAGQEVVFNNDRYRKNLGELEVLAPLGVRQGVGLRAMFEQLHFIETDEPIFLDYKHDRGALFHEMRLTPLWSLRTSFLAGQGVQERPPSPIFEEEEEFKSTDARVALRGPLGRQGFIEARLGYLTWDFDNPALADYSGLNGEVRGRLILQDRASLTVTATQVVLPSFFNVNSHYLTRVFDARWTREGESRLFYMLSAGYRTNEYPEPVTDEATGTVVGPRREDNLWRGEASVGYKFNTLFKVEGRFRHEERSSNIDKTDFNSNRFGLVITWAWI
jgi:hypothetical protein